LLLVSAGGWGLAELVVDIMLQAMVGDKGENAVGVHGADRIENIDFGSAIRSHLRGRNKCRLGLYLRDMKRANREFAQPLDAPQADA
jgi:hypothetical protein